jgi:aminopeptidase N
MKKTTISITLLILMLLPFASAKAQTPGENIDVTHYEIHVWDFDFANRTLQGETFIDFTTSASTSTIVLELKTLTVTDVAADFYTVESFSQEGDFLTVTFDEPIEANEQVTLDVRYGGATFSETWGGVEWWGSDRVYNLGVGFDSQPHNLGKAWFPCVDNFTDKATYDLYITATNDKKAICGGNLVETIDNGDGTSTWHWNTPQEIATYHISFVVGDYEVWEDVYQGIERDIPIEVWATPGQMSLVPGTFVHIKEIVAFFEENLGPYPFNRIGYVSTSKGCMEHTDNIAFASSIINGNTSGEEYVAHELSHMWSGNLVTCEEAGDMWLNEGFAQFWGAFYEAGVYGEQHFQNTMSALVNSINTWCSKSSNWLPLNNMPLDMTYDSDAVYDRGAVIVNTMMNYMGRENFLSAMRQYFDQYAYQAATSEQLCEALTQYSGINMHDFFDTYVYSSGMPHLYANIASVSMVGNQYEVVLDLRYQHIGDSHIGQSNRYDVTFVGPEFQLATEKVEWDGLHGSAIVTLDFEPMGIVNDFNNNWLDGRTQKNLILKGTSQQNFAYFTAKPDVITDSIFVSVENHLVAPYDDPLVPYLTLSTKHFWTINRYDFGEAEVEGWFDYSKANDGDIIETQNDSATLLYRKNASEAWH